jgi:AraC family ethanolamine operon transcriptional activator
MQSDSGAIDGQIHRPNGGQTAGEAPYSLHVLVSRDADEHAQNLKEWQQTYDQISPGQFEGTLIDAWFGGIQMFREITNQRVHESGSAWPAARSFAIPMAMDGCAHAGAQKLTEERVLTIAPDEGFDLRTSESFDVVGISVGVDELASLSQALEGCDVESLMQGTCLIALPPERMAELRTFLASAFEVIRNDSALLRHRQVQRGLRSALLNTLLGAISEARHVPVGWREVSHRKVVESAKNYVLDRADEPVTVEELCKAVGVSRRSLQTCFHEVMGTNPVNYLRTMRLNAARRELRRHDGRTRNIADVAARWGFWHLSHFATDYRNLFGELPSNTLARSRGARG